MERTINAPSTADTLSAVDSSEDAEPRVPSVRRAVLEPEQGTQVGRYVVLSRLGAGAMGIVLAAYDPQLDRKVAIKLIKPRGRDTTSARTRLQREAQSLAKLAHPNVVAVHDVGVHEGQVFVAMEFVAGVPLDVWLARDEPRSWREIVTVFEAAGRGLAAAHGAGLVHRDFKPENVLFGNDGRVRVMDFGLACSVEDETSMTGSGDEFDAFRSAETSGNERTRLTLTGALLGTPAYMAPEQFEGEGVTARSDQFGFCVALYQALYGVRPFAGESVTELAYSVTTGDMREPARDVDVPAWLRRVVLRGLSREPGDRYGSMDDLLAELGTGDARRRRHRRLAALSTVALAALSTLGYQRYAEAAQVETCAAQGDRIDEIWNADAKEALHAGLLATGAPYAPTMVDRVTPWIDAQAESWREQAATVCMDAVEPAERPTEMIDKAQWCLEQRLLQIETVVGGLTDADEGSVRRSVRVAAGLQPVALCTDPAVLVGMASPPEQSLRPAVTEVQRRLAQVRYLDGVGRHDEGLQLARELEAEARALAWAPLQATVDNAKAAVLLHAGSYAEAEAAGTDAYMRAVQAGAWDVASDAASGLAHVVGHRRARHSEGLLWARQAAAVAEHAGDPLGLREARRLLDLGSVQRSMGEYAEAVQSYERAIALYQRTLGPDHPRVAQGLNSLGNALFNQGEFARARSHQERSLALWERALGPDHPDLATSLNAIGNTAVEMGEHDEARGFYGRALALREAAWGPEHLRVAESLNNLGVLEYMLGNYEEARARYERALKIFEATVGPDHPHVARTSNNLGNVYYSQGQYEFASVWFERTLSIQSTVLGEQHPDVATTLSNLANVDLATGELRQAKARYARALAIQRVSLGDDHPSLGLTSANLGHVHRELGEYPESKVSYEQSLAIWERALGPEHPRLADALTGFGMTLGLLGEHRQAVEVLERAVVLRTGDAASPKLRHQSELALADALWEAPNAMGGDRSRAHALAQAARDALAEQGAVMHETLAEAEQWLREHPAPA